VYFPIKIEDVRLFNICRITWFVTTKSYTNPKSDRYNKPQRCSTCFSFYCLLPSLPAVLVSSYIPLQVMLFKIGEYMTEFLRLSGTFY